MKTKNLLFIGAFILTANSFAQGFSVDNLNDKKLLYVGYENKVTFQQIGCEYDDFKIESVNCSVTQLDDANSKDIYLVKPNRQSTGQIAKIYFIANDKKVDSALFHVEVMPAPSIYWGNFQSGSKFSNSKGIQLKYATGVTINNTFDIVNWKCENNGKKFSAEGNELSSEFIDFTKTMKTGESILITINYTGPDGVLYAKNGFWIKE